ncbi:conserved hypothetical protein [Hyphomicrobiales bacterium]|nr:conserved hypothetical protein [Hyphomicrobiales bacterium]CAH1669101.1 conserved hypothetical protein [Hyphomicrobiales bacterium]
MDNARDAAPWPTELRLSSDKRTLTIAFDDGQTFALSAEYLRVKSPSAEVRGHSPSDRKTVGGKINVTILSIERMGHYAVRPVFDDMHDTGIYTWEYLHELGAQQSQIWSAYLDELDRKGLRREPIVSG